MYLACILPLQGPVPHICNSHACHVASCIMSNSWLWVLLWEAPVTWGLTVFYTMYCNYKLILAQLFSCLSCDSRNFCLSYETHISSIVCSISMLFKLGMLACESLNYLLVCSIAMLLKIWECLLESH